jgi:hypothetical protein
MHEISFPERRRIEMQGRKIIPTVMAVFVVFAALPAAVMGAAVSAECAYIKTDTKLVCDVYVNTGADQLRSGGVLLNYNTSILSSPVATKNDAIWKFTDGTTNYPYMTPDTSAPGKVVFIVGMLNTTNTSAGVSGARVKVGNVTFTRNATPTSGDGLAQAAFFGISAALGKGGNYVNFVNTAGAPLDGGATFSARVAQRGDANADGVFDGSDYIAVRYWTVTNPTNFPPYADCTGEGILDGSDYICIRQRTVN